MYLLDTDHLSVLERGGAIAQNLVSKMSVLSLKNINVTVITYESKHVADWVILPRHVT